MPLKVKELPKTERPYEKLKIKGAEHLTNAELLAIIIKSGTKDENSITIAERLLLLTEKLEDLQNISIQDLKKIRGIGEVKAIQIKAICELSKRMRAKSNEIYFKIRKPQDVADMLIDEMRNEKQEVIKVVMLSAKNIVLKVKNVVTGTINCANVSLADILTEPVKMQVNKIILVHNHPSGDPTPSLDDINLTNKLEKAADFLGIKLLDHIVIGKDSFESILRVRNLR